MTQVAVVIPAHDAFGGDVCRAFVSKGWTVFGGLPAGERAPAGVRELTVDVTSIVSMEAAAQIVSREAGSIDMLVCNAGTTVPSTSTEKPDSAALLSAFDTRALGAVRAVEAFLPLMDNGMKRLCFITDGRGSTGAGVESGRIAESMSSAGLHMAVAILGNDLRGDGYTFRLYAAGTSGDEAVDYFVKARDDEFRITVAGDGGLEWPF